MARKLTVGRAPQGHPLRGGSPISRGGARFAGARGKAPSGGGGRPAGRAKPTTRGNYRYLHGFSGRQRSAGSR